MQHPHHPHRYHHHHRRRRQRHSNCTLHRIGPAVGAGGAVAADAGAGDVSVSVHRLERLQLWSCCWAELLVLACIALLFE